MSNIHFVDWVEEYETKPCTIKAIYWTGDNFVKVDEFLGDFPHRTYPADGRVEIDTLEGTMVANRFDYIVKGLKGEFYPVKEDIFRMKYRPKD